MDLLSGRDLKEQGIYRAISHADGVYQDWSEMAYKMLQDFIRFSDGDTFMCEDVRQYAEKFTSLPSPPNNRAWGGIIGRARKNGIIKHCGFSQVRNPKAHQANASLWKGA